jgi:hypothetical protein
VDPEGKFKPKYKAIISWTKDSTRHENKCEVLVDDQASRNFICRELVSEAELRHNLTKNTEIKLSDGNTCKELCRVPLPCELKLSKKVADSPLNVQDFYVLPRTIVQVVLGIPFLRAAGLLMDPTVANIPSYLKAYVGFGESPNMEANTMPNRGADVNMMSKDYADQHQDQLKAKSKNRRIFELGNGRMIAEEEKGVKEAKIRFTTGSSSTSTLKNPAIIQGLPAVAVLSNEFLSKNNIPGRNWTNEPEIIDGLYAILWRKKAVASKLN